MTYQLKKWVVALGAVVLLGIGSTQPATAQMALANIEKLPASSRQPMYQAMFEQRVAWLYTTAGLARTGLSLTVLREALVGYYNLRQSNSAKHPGMRPSLLTVVDFSRSSQLKRLWVLDVERGKVLFNTLVAHGKNTGDDFARAFSNENGSEQSSLGFYRTAYDTYEGKHGLSLKLKGLDPGYNTNAESRAVVVHGAEYVCASFVKQHGRLGRSQGCPALPVAETPAIVRTIKGGSILYLHGPAQAGYHSPWLDMDSAVAAFGSEVARN